MSHDYDIIKELRNAEKERVFHSKTMAPSVDCELDEKHSSESSYQAKEFFDNVTSSHVPNRLLIEQIFYSAPLPVLFKNNQGIYTLVNDAFCRFLGRSREEILGKTDFDILYKDDAQASGILDKKVMETGESILEEMKVTSYDGDRWIKISRTPVTSKGLLIGVLWCFLDVYEEGESKYGFLFDKLLNACAHHKIITDEKGNPVDYVFLDVNHSFEKIINLKKQDVIGKRVTEVLKGIENDSTDWIGIYGRVALHDEALEFESYSQMLKRWYHVQAYSSRKGYFTTIFDDITSRKVTDEKLAEERKQLDYIMKATRTYIDILDTDLNLHYVDSAWQKIYGDPHGRKCYEYFMGLDAPCPTCAVPRALETKEIVVSEEFLPKENRNIEVHTIPFRNNKGEWMVAEFNIDITEHKLKEDMIRENNARFNQLAEQNRTIIWEVDADGLYTYISHLSEKILGFSPEELVGKMHFYDIHPEKGRENFKHQAFTVFNSKESFKDLENPIETKDGHIVWVSTNGIPLLNADGTLSGYRGSDTDITVRKQAEDAVKENESKLDTFFSQSLAGFFFMMLDEPIEWKESSDKERILDYVFHHHRITKVNQALIDQYGAKKEEFLGSTPSDLFNHDLNNGRYLLRLLFDEGRFHREIKQKRKDGSEIWVVGDYICMYDSEGRILGNFGIQTDITEQKKTKLELQEKIATLERYKQVTVDRELKMIELKKENSKLKKLLSESID